MKKIELLIDVGGTSTKYAITSDKQIIYSNKFSTHLDDIKKYKPILKSNLQELHEKYKFQNIYISTTGVVNKIGVITHANNKFSEYRGFNWKEFLNEILPSVKLVRSLNDAKALARYNLKSEQEKDFVSFTIGTGVGLSIVKNGEIMFGNDGICGEIGSLIWKDDLKVDEYFSATKLNHKIKNILNKEDWSFSNLEKAIDDNKEVKLIFETWASEFSKLISWVVTIINPKIIYIAGGISYSGDILQTTLTNELKKNIPDFLSYNINLKISKNFNDSNMIGLIL